MDTFTQDEKERINQLYGTDFKDITPDDALLIGRWESYKALIADEHKANIEAIERESKAKIEQSKTQFEQAMSNMNELHEAALKRLEVIENGQ